MKIKLGIMSNVWECEAENVDIAVATLMLRLQTTAPIAIYEPSTAISEFSFMGIDNDEKKTKTLTDFLDANKDEIRKCNKTFQSITYTL